MQRGARRGASPGPALALALGFALALGVALALGLAACAPRAPEPSAPPPPSAAAPAPVAAAGDEPPRRDAVRVVYSSVDPSQTPLWVAHDMGLFSALGLDVELLFVESGTRALNTLLAGEAPLGTVGASSVIGAVGSGAELSMLAGLTDRFPYKLLVVPAVQQPADLRGRKLGISRFGSSSDVSTRIALKRFGLNPDTDVQIIQVGADPQRVAAMQMGSIDGAVLTPPGSTVVRKAGYHELLDLSRLPESDYAQNTAVATRAFIATQRQVVERFVRGLVEGMHFASTEPEATKRVIGHYNELSDPDAMDDAWRLYYGPGAELVTRAPYVKPRALAVAMEEVAVDRPEVLRLRTEDLVDDSFVRALEDSGFIRRLYGE